MICVIVCICTCVHICIYIYIHASPILLVNPPFSMHPRPMAYCEQHLQNPRQRWPWRNRQTWEIGISQRLRKNRSRVMRDGVTPRVGWMYGLYMVYIWLIYIWLVLVISSRKMRVLNETKIAVYLHRKNSGFTNKNNDDFLSTCGAIRDGPSGHRMS